MHGFKMPGMTKGKLSVRMLHGRNPVHKTVTVLFQVTPVRAQTEGRDPVQHLLVRRLRSHMEITGITALLQKKNPSSNGYFTGFLESNHTLI